MKSLKSNVERAKLAKVFMYMILGASILMFGVEIYGYALINDVVADNSFTYEEIDRLDQYDMINLVIAVVYLIIQIVTVVFFILWFRRAYWNLHQLTKGLRFTEGWAAGAWFVPIFNWFGPYQIATDLYVKTENLLISKELVKLNPKIHTVKGWWWTLWVASGIVSIFSRGDETLAQIQTALIVDMTSSIFAIGAAILAVKVIANYHALEVKLKHLEDVTQSNPENEDLIDAL